MPKQSDLDSLIETLPDGNHRYVAVRYLHAVSQGEPPGAGTLAKAMRRGYAYRYARLSLEHATAFNTALVAAQNIYAGSSQGDGR